MATCTVPKWWGVNRGGMNLILTLGYEAGVTALMEHRHRWATVPVPLSHLSLCPTPPPCSFGFDGAGTVSGYKGRCYAPGTPGLSEGCVEHLINRILFPVDPCSFFGQEAKIESLRRLTGFAEEKTLSQSSSWASITGCGHIPPQFH